MVSFCPPAWHLRLKQYYPESESSPSEGAPEEIINPPPAATTDSHNCK